MTFKWNNLSRQSYLYFLNARVAGHSLMFFDALPVNNVYYPCIKDNGDLNSVIASIKVEPIESPLVTKKDLYSIWAVFSNCLVEDMNLGLIGKLVYVIYKKNDRYFLYRIELESYKYKKQIIKKLYQYREGKFKSKNNEMFNQGLLLCNELNPQIRTDPRKKNKSYLFKSKILWEKDYD